MTDKALMAQIVGLEHQIDELLEHRYALFGALLKIYDNYITPLGATPIRCWKTRLTSEGDLMTGYFVAGMRRMNIDGTEFQVSYKLPLKLWDSINVIEVPRAPKEKPSDPNDVIGLLARL